MIVTFTRQVCYYCDKSRLHECFDAFAKCVSCYNVTEILEGGHPHV
jgi:hypothetical protein